MKTKIHFILAKLAKRTSKGERLAKGDESEFATALLMLNNPLDRESVEYLEQLALGCDWRFYKEYLACIEAAKISQEEPSNLFEAFCRDHFQKGLELLTDVHQHFSGYGEAEDRMHELLLNARLYELFIGYSEQYENELVAELGQYETSHDISTLLDVVGEKCLSDERCRHHRRELEPTCDKWEREGIYSSPEYDHHRHAILANAIGYMYDKRLLTKRLIRQLGTTIEEVLSTRNVRNAAIYICKQDLYSALACKNKTKLQFAWTCMTQYILDRDSDLANRLLLVASKMRPSELVSLLRLARLHFELLDDYGRAIEDSIFHEILDNQLTLFETLIKNMFDSGRWTRAMLPILRKLWWDVFLTETLSTTIMPAIVWHHLACSGRKDERAQNNSGQYFTLMRKTLDASVRESNLSCFVNSVAALLMAVITKNREGEGEASLELILDNVKLFIRRQQGAVVLRDLLLKASHLLRGVHADDENVRRFCETVNAYCDKIRGKVPASVHGFVKVPYKLRLEKLQADIQRELTPQLLGMLDKRTLDLLLRAELQFADEHELDGEAPIYNHAILSYANCILNEFVVKRWRSLRNHELLKQRIDLRMKKISMTDVGNVVTLLSKANKSSFLSHREHTLITGFAKELDFINDLGKMRNWAAHDEKIDREQAIIFRGKLFNEKKLYNLLQLLNL